VFADADKLLHTNLAFDDDVVFEFYVPGKVDIVSNDDVVSQDAIVGYVGVGHDQTVTADNGFTSRGSAAIYSNVLPNGRPVADMSGRVLSSKLEVLRFAADNGARGNFYVLTQPATGIDGYVWSDFRTCPNNYIVFDVTERAYGNAVAYFGVRMNYA
jgi:hypothetical protein